MKIKYLVPFLLIVFIFSFMGCMTTTTETTASAQTRAATAETAAPETTTSATTSVDNNNTEAEVTNSSEIAANTETTEAAAEAVFGLDIVGMWNDKDGTIRIFSPDGTCQNIAKIDIGGPPPVYTISDKPNKNGYYILFVSQSGYNQTTFYVKVISSDEIEIYENPGAAALYSLTRM